MADRNAANQQAEPGFGVTPPPSGPPSRRRGIRSPRVDLDDLTDDVIRGAEIFLARAGHAACVLEADAFVPALLAVCPAVAARQ